MRSVGGMAMLLAVLLPGAVGSGCSAQCVASCFPPSTRVSIGAGLGAVEVCDSEGMCTRQEFGPEMAQVVSRSFTLTTPFDDGSTELLVRGFSSTGAEVVSGTVTATYGEADCGCPGFALVYVDDEGVGAIG